MSGPLFARPNLVIPFQISTLLESRRHRKPNFANRIATGKTRMFAAKMTNARSETAATKPAFRDALKSSRCLIPADAFYEWMRTGKAKQPYCFEVGEGELFAFAGIWDRWKDGSGNAVETCSMLTTAPNAVTSPVHDRLPVILEPDM